MSKEDHDIDRFVKDPVLLANLCREVIEQLDIDSDNADFGEQEAQLREISWAIERLEKAGVAIPDPLRAEKTRLAVVVGIKAEVFQALDQLASEFEEILQDLKARLGRNGNPSGLRKAREKVVNSGRIRRDVLREHIILALRNLGGRAQKADVLEEMEKLLKGKLLPDDLIWSESRNCCSWEESTRKERSAMVTEGILCKDSPVGIWELSEAQR